jgi:hypothetical protein
MKITTVDPFSATPAAPADSAAHRDIPDSEITDPFELVARLATERKRIADDAEALELREANLKDYEARLRTLQKELDGNQRGGTSRSASPFLGRSGTPFSSDASLDAAWQKLHRARELCEAEQAHLRDDRIAMQAFELELKQRELAVAAREAQVAEQEAILAASAQVASETPPPIAEPSAFRRLTRMPFLVAESVLRGKNSRPPQPAVE